MQQDSKQTVSRGSAHSETYAVTNMSAPVGPHCIAAAMVTTERGPAIESQPWSRSWPSGEVAPGVVAAVMVVRE